MWPFCYHQALKDWGKGIKSDLNYSVKSFTFSMQCRLSPAAILFMACKERYNLWMNCALLDHKLLDHVSWTSTTAAEHSFTIVISLYFSLCWMAFCSIRKLLSKVPFVRGYPPKIHYLKYHNKKALSYVTWCVF